MTCEPFTVEAEGGKLVLGGRFGVFYAGRVTVAFTDRQGKELGRAALAEAVGPGAPVVLSERSKFTAPLSVPRGAVQAMLLVCDAQDRPLGVLAAALVP